MKFVNKLIYRYTGININQLLGNEFINIIRHAKNYFIATIALKAASLLTIPILTRYLSTQEYGIIALYNSYLSILIIAMPLYLYAAIGRYFYESQKDFESFVGTSTLLSIFTYIISSFLLIFFPLRTILFSNVSNTIFYLLVFTSGFKIVSGIYYLILIPTRNSKQTAWLQIVEGYINVTITVVLTLVLPQNKYFGPIIGILISSLVVFIYSIVKLNHFIIFKIDISHIKYILLYSIPQLPYALSGVLNEHLGRILIGKTQNYSDLGIYSLGFQVSSIYIIITSAIRTALIPDFYKHMNLQEHNRISQLWQKFYYIALIPASVLMIYSKEFIIILSTSNYIDSYKIVPIIIIGYLFFDMFYIYSPYIEYKKHTGVLSAIIVSGGILNIFLGYYFIQNYGYLGAAYSFVSTYLLIFLITWVVLKLFYKIKVVPIKHFIRPLIIIIILSLIVLSSVMISNSIINFTARTIIFILFTIYIFNSIKNITKNYSTTNAN